MNAKTLTALKASIAHWERMRDDRECGELPDCQDCPLCKRFLNRSSEEFPWCLGCPVARNTGRIGCQNTPWQFANATFSVGSNRQWRKAAQAEIDFLKSLLPKERK